MFKSSLSLLALICLSAVGAAQDYNVYQRKHFINGNDTLPYRLLLPSNYDATKKYPLIFVMHGAGERGNDNESQLTHGAKLFLQDSVRNKHAAIVVFPQCPRNSYWSNVGVSRGDDNKVQFNFMLDTPATKAMELAQGLLYELLRSYPVNKKQVYVAGLSMGGMGTFEIVRRNPTIFAAAVPICGGGNPATAPKMIKTNWWIFHGAKDDIVPVHLSEQMNGALLKAGAKVKFTVYPEANHNSWDPAFGEPALLSWLFAQHL